MGRIGLNPDAFTEGQLLDNFTGIIKEARTSLFTYPGTTVEGPSLKLTIGHGEGNAEIYEQQYSAGRMADFVPTEDGTGFDGVGDKTSLSKSSNVGMLIMSLVNSGFPKALLDVGDFTVLDGTLCHFLREVQPERAGIANPEGADGKKKGPRTVLLVSEVKALPGGKPATATKTTTAAAKKPGPVAVPAAAKATPAPAPAPAAAAAPAGDAAALDEKLRDFLMEKLTESNEAGDLVRPNGLKKKELVPLVFSTYKADAVMRNYGTKRVVQAEFLAAEDAPWSFADDVLAMAG